ncbi:MAG: tripartite tricarboxylate transporter substrate binding protein BugD [Betaproteobacteria bacterium]|nr:tripartite tricarboxylate transporter substrate binding protein BugD [Betaproteobacteria bacterium]
MKALLVICVLAATVGASSSGTAQSYPSKPVTIVVPFSAGGPTDTLARIVGERMRKPLGQPVLVDNTTGAGGSVGTGKVVRAPPDGYLVSIGHWGTHVVNGVYYSLPFNVLTDFEPVAMIATNPQVIISKNAVPAGNLKELIAWISANQDKVLMGTGGIGGASHMAAIYFGDRIGVKFHYVPYRGGAPALQALLGGEFDLYVTQVSNITTHVKSGRVRAYAVTAKTRQAAAPEIPTVDEAGLPGLHTAIWHGIWLPKNTPKDVVMKLNAAIVETLADPGVRKRFGDLGQEIPPREQQTPEALFVHHKSEIDKWWPIIKASGLKAE